MSSTQTTQTARTDRVEHRKAITAVHYGLLCLLLLVLFLVATVGWSSEDLVRPLCLLLALDVAWLLFSWWAVGNHLLDPYGLFLVAAVLFNAGQAILEVVFSEGTTLLGGRFPPGTLVETLLFVTVSLHCLHLGALLASAHPQTTPEAVAGQPQTSDGDVAQVGWVLLLLSAVPTLILAKQAVSTVLSAGYFGLYQEAESGGRLLTALGQFTVPAALFLLASSRKRPLSRLVAIGVIAAHTGVYAFIGHRRLAVMPLVAFAWLWHRCTGRIRGVYVVAGGVILLSVVFPLIKVVRSTTGSDRMTLDTLTRTYGSAENPTAMAVREMGGTMVTVAYTLELVPSSRSYDLGRGYLYALLTAIPNVFGGVHPTVRRGLAAKWLVETVSPGTAKLGGGLAYSFIAEAYLNFGWLGAPLVLLPLGFWFQRLTMWAQSGGETARLAMLASFLSFFLVFARSESASLVRFFVWYSYLPYVAAVRLTRSRRAVVARSVTDVTGAE